MRKRRLVMILAVVAMVMGVMAPAGAGGLTAEKLGATPAYTCFVAGPHLWTHCVTGGGKATNVMVFGHFGPDGIDPGDGTPGDYDGYAVGDPLLGTEILLDASVYHGQPCSTDGGGLYHDLRGDGTAPPGTGPFACHHFATS